MKLQLLTEEDLRVLKTLLQYAFADTPSFENLTETERAIIGDQGRFERFVAWACEEEPNPYVTGHDPRNHWHPGGEKGISHQHTDLEADNYLEEVGTKWE